MKPLTPTLREYLTKRARFHMGSISVFMPTPNGDQPLLSAKPHPQHPNLVSCRHIHPHTGADVYLDLKLTDTIKIYKAPF